MEVKGEYLIESPREAVWAALNDTDMLRKCIPGCESLEKTGDNEFQGKVAAAVGPVRAKFNVVIRLENAVPPESYTLSGESKAGAVGFGKGSADVRLKEQENGTLLTYSAGFKVGGKLAQVGSRLVVGATRKTADDFFSSLSRELSSGAEAPAPSGEAPGTAQSGDDGSRALPALRIALGAAVVGLLAWWFLLR